MSFETTESGAGEPFLLMFCRAYFIVNLFFIDTGTKIPWVEIPDEVPEFGMISPLGRS